MARSFPRFLLSKSSNGKTKGIFIVHTVEPEFICSVEIDDGRQVKEIAILKTFGEFNRMDVSTFAYDNIPNWWRHSGIHESEDPRDQVISKLSKLEFLKTAPTPHYTVDNVRQVVRILFPSKSKNIYTGVSSYGLKHDLERISRMFIPNRNISKYCSNETMKQAMEEEGFLSRKDSPGNPNEYYNISEKDYRIIRKILIHRSNPSSAII